MLSNLTKSWQRLPRRRELQWALAGLVDHSAPYLGFRGIGRV